MVNFSCQIVLAEYEKADGMRRVYLQAIIDRQPARVSVGFCIEAKHFDARSGRIRATHPNAESYNTELQMAITRANDIASQTRLKKRRLTPALFREEFENPTGDIDVIAFIKSELALRLPELEHNTIKAHNTFINKLEGFQRKIFFIDLTPNLMQRFKNDLIKKGNRASTVDKTLKVFKQYLKAAKKKGYEFEDPFVAIKIKNYKSNRLALSEQELKRLDEYYERLDTPLSHKKLLRYFLFSCYTGLRISDISVITWNNVHDDLLTYIPVKTKGMNKEVTVPLTKEKKYLPEFKPGNHPIFDTYSDPVTNRYLKAVAAKVDIKKNVTYHTARHTFGTLMAEGGHLPETQKMMGHGSIKTTMEYVHTSNKSLIEAKNRRFSDEAKHTTN